MVPWCDGIEAIAIDVPPAASAITPIPPRASFIRGRISATLSLEESDVS
jgi:hypothetical protein